MHAIWLAKVWVILRECNVRLFQQKEKVLPKLLDKIKLLSLWWMKASKIGFDFDINNWWDNPTMFLG